MATMDSVDAQIAVNGAFAQAEAFVANVIEDFDAGQVEQVADLVNELGQAFAINRLSFLAATAADYPARKRGGGGNPNWKGGSKGGGASSGDGVTAPQRGLLERLLDEKVGASDVFDGKIDSLTKATASQTIEKLIALEDKE